MFIPNSNSSADCSINYNVNIVLCLLWNIYFKNTTVNKTKIDYNYYIDYSYAFYTLLPRQLY